MTWCRRAFCSVVSVFQPLLLAPQNPKLKGFAADLRNVLPNLPPEERPRVEKMDKAPSQDYLSDVPDDGEQNLVDCTNCGRHFSADRIETHEWICQKLKKRKPFDICLQRVKGTDAEKFYTKNRNRIKTEKTTYPSPQKNWRKQHEEFIMSMKAAKQVTAFLKKGGNLRDLPPPPPSDYSDYIQCPTCLRKFNHTAAERHIPKCAEMQHKAKPAPPKNSVKTPRVREMSARSKK